MKTKLLICCYPADFSGVPIYVKNIYTNITEDYDVRILTSHSGKIFDELKEHLIIRSRLKNNFNPFSLITNFKLLAETIKKENPEIIHLNGAAFGFLGRFISIFSKRKFIYTYHGLPWGDGRSRLVSGLMLFIEFFALNFCNADNITISKMDKERLEKINFTSKKIHYVVNSVDFKAQPKKNYNESHSNKINIINVARYSKQKNFPRLFNAFNLLSDQYNLSLVGEGTDSVECIKLANSICSVCKTSKINFGGLSNNVSSHLAKADIFVLSSDYEGMPLSAIEAMASGIPIIMPFVGGAEEFESCGAALVYRPNNAKELAKKIEELSSNPSLLDKMKAASLEGFERLFSKDVFIQKITKIYETKQIR